MAYTSSTWSLLFGYALIIYFLKSNNYLGTDQSTWIPPVTPIMTSTLYFHHARLLSPASGCPFVSATAQIIPQLTLGWSQKWMSCTYTTDDQPSLAYVQKAHVMLTLADSWAKPSNMQQFYRKVLNISCNWLNAGLKLVVWVSPFTFRTILGLLSTWWDLDRRMQPTQQTVQGWLLVPWPCGWPGARLAALPSLRRDAESMFCWPGQNIKIQNLKHSVYWLLPLLHHCEVGKFQVGLS